jgi:hypothetical protein
MENPILKNIKTGQIISVHTPFVAYKPHRYLSSAIRLFTNSFWSHTGIFIWVYGTLCVAEADPKVKITPFREWCKDKIIKVSQCRLPIPISENRIANIILSKQGFTNYDFSSLLFFQPIYQLTGIWLGRTYKKKADTKLYCSEYVAWCYNQYNGMFIDYYKISPSDLAKDTRFKDIYVGPAKNLLL